jgi:hypothetical protein
MDACRSSLENTGEMSLIPIINKNLPRVHTESKFDVLGVYEKLVKYVVHCPKEKIEKKLFFFIQAVQTAIDQFVVSRNLGIKRQ